MAEVPAVVQTQFVFTNESLPPGAILYREGLRNYENWYGMVQAKLATYDQRIAALKGTADQVAQASLAIYKEREAALERLLETTPKPANPFDDPRITDADRKAYHEAEGRLLAQSQKDIKNITYILGVLADWSEAIAVQAEADIVNLEEQQRKRDERAKRTIDRQMSKSRTWGYITNISSTVLAIIPTWVTELAGAIIAIGGTVGKAVYDSDRNRRYVNALRNHANWLIYQAPQLLDRISLAESDLDILVGQEDIAEAIEESLGLREQINNVKLAKGIYDERVLLAEKTRRKYLTYAAYAIGGLGLVWLLTKGKHGSPK